MLISGQPAEFCSWTALIPYLCSGFSEWKLPLCPRHSKRTALIRENGLFRQMTSYTLVILRTATFTITRLLDTLYGVLVLTSG